MSEVGHERWWSSWFSLAREDGGPTYYPHQYFACPDFAWNLHTVVSTVVFILPILIFVILLPSFRNKQWSSLMVVLLCFLTGFILTVVMWSSSWLVGEAEVTMSVGPLQPPINGTVGVWAGLWHVSLTYISDHFSLNEMVTWNSRLDLVKAHRAALRDGWPWALLSLTAELGGEGSGWRGCLGDGIRKAGLVSSYLLVASIYVWVVWVVLFTVAPELTARPLMVTGLLMTLCTLVYVVFIGVHVPPEFIVGGATMHLHLGLAWWLTLAMGVMLTIAGASLLLYNAKYPGHLSTFFEIDFGLVSHRSFHPAWGHEPVFAYKQVGTYSQYPLFISSRENACINNCQRNEPGEDGNNDENKKDMNEESHEKTPHDRMEGDVIQDENIDHSHKHSAPKIHFCLESETSGLPDTSLTSHQWLSPHTSSTVTLSCGTLADDQEHTPLELEPSTLRRRSPEQIVEQQQTQQASSLGTTAPEPSLSDSGSDSSSEEAPRHSPRPTTPSFVRSYRDSLKLSLSEARAKLYPRVSTRLTLHLPKSESRTHLVSEEDLHHKMEPVPKKVFESRTKF